MSPTITPTIRLVRFTSARASSLGAVAQLVGRRQHAAARRLRDRMRRAVQHARGGGDRDACAAADVGERRQATRAP